MERNKPRRRERATYENRYRHKLNMLWDTTSCKSPLYAAGFFLYNTEAGWGEAPSPDD